MKYAFALLALAALPLLASAQTVWRCGPDGRSFSDTPCVEGRALTVAEPRPAEDVAEARVLAEREKRLAERMRRERLQEEAAQRGNGLASLGPTADSRRETRADPKWVKAQTRAPAAKQQPSLRQTAPSADETWRAVDPASRRTKG